MTNGAVKSTDVLIVGAGPFGIAMAAHAQSLGLDHALLGRPMEFVDRPDAEGDAASLGPRLAP